MAKLIETKEKRTLSVKLTKEEMLERSDELIDTLATIDDRKAQLAEFRRGVRETVKSLARTADQLRRAIRLRREDREVEVTIRKDFTSGMITVLNGHEVVEHRPMRETEKQMEMVVPEYSTAKAMDERQMDRDMSDVFRSETRRISKRSACD